MHCYKFLGIPCYEYYKTSVFQIIYNKHSGTLAIADSKLLCLRQDYGGTFLLKTALKRSFNKTVPVELPLDEVVIHFFLIRKFY